MAKTVKIYSTPACSYCVKVKQFLKDNKIVYEDFDVSRDQVKADEMVAKSGQIGVPTIDIDGEIIVGFDKERIKKSLNL